MIALGTKCPKLSHTVTENLLGHNLNVSYVRVICNWFYVGLQTVSDGI